MAAPQCREYHELCKRKDYGEGEEDGAETEVPAGEQADGPGPKGVAAFPKDKLFDGQHGQALGCYQQGQNREQIKQNIPSAGIMLPEGFFTFVGHCKSPFSTAHSGAEGVIHGCHNKGMRAGYRVAATEVQFG